MAEDLYIGDSHRQQPERGYWWLLALAYAAALGLAALRFWCSKIVDDYAVCGLLGLAFSRGEFPLFFYGQNFMGSLDGLLAAPLYLLFGPGVLTLNFWPPVLWLGIIVVMHRLLRMFFRPLGVAAGVLLMAVPPGMWLCWAGMAQTHYPLALFLSAWMMLLTARLWRVERWPWHLAFLWGLAGGLAVWTNFQAAVVVLPCGVFLLATRWRQLLGRSLPWVLLGILVGAGPLLYYDFTHGWVHLGQQQAFQGISLDKRPLRLFANALPIVLGIKPFLTADKLDPRPWWAFGVYLTVLGLLSAAAAGLAVEGFRRGRRFLWVPLLVAGTNLLVVMFTIYGRLLYHAEQRYLLPLYLLLPFLWAWLAQEMGRRRKWPAAVFLVGMLAVHVGFYASQPICGYHLLCGGCRYQKCVEPGIKAVVAQFRQRGWHRAYFGNLTWSFLAGDDPVFSHPWGDRRASASVKVDVDPQAVFISRPLPGRDLRPNLELLGVGFAVDQGKGWPGPVYHSFQPPRRAGALFQVPGMRARTLAGRELGGRLCDGDVGTFFATGRPARPGQGLVLDLGAEHEVAGFVLFMPDPYRVPWGLRLEAAGEDGEFHTLRVVKDLMPVSLYWSGPHPFLKLRLGRLEAYFPPRRLRYLRLTHLGRSKSGWEVGEVFFVAPAVARARPTWREDGPALVRLARKLGLKRVLADAWLSAYLRRAGGGRFGEIISNLSQDDYGAGRNTLPLLPPLRAREGEAVVVKAGEADLCGRLLSASGVRFTRHQAGGLAVFALHGRGRGQPLPLVAVDSNVDRVAAAQLVRGRPAAGRWGSQAPQRPGVWLQVDLGRVREIGGFYLGCPDHPQDYARGLKVWLSDDGSSWRLAPHHLVWPLVFCGRLPLALAGPRSTYRLDSTQKARFLRLELDASLPVWWWSVEELKVLAP